MARRFAISSDTPRRPSGLGNRFLFGLSSVTEVPQALWALFPAFGPLRGGSRGENHPCRAPFGAVFRRNARKERLRQRADTSHGDVSAADLSPAAGEDSARRPGETARCARNRGAPGAPTQVGPGEKKMKNGKKCCKRNAVPWSAFSATVGRVNEARCLATPRAGTMGAICAHNGRAEPGQRTRCISLS